MLAFALVHLAQTVALVHPTTTLSPDGHLRLSVDPSERQGKGPAHGRLERDGHLVWERELASTPRDAFVEDSGVVAYWSLTGFVILAPDGSERAAEPVEGQPRQGFGNASTHEYTLRVGTSGEEWWSFALEADRPPRKLPFPGCAPDFDPPLLARAVPGTPFTLVLERASWWTARFRLLDADLKELWRAPEEDPKQKPGDWRIARWMASGAPLVCGPAPRTFTTLRASEDETRRYEVVPPAVDGGAWTIAERAREHFVPALEPPTPRCVPIELEQLGETWLGPHASNASSLHGCVALAFGKELLEGVRREAGHFERFTCNARGELVERQVFPWKPPANALVFWSRLEPGRWVAATSDLRSRRAELITFDGPAGAAHTLRRWKDVDLVALDARADAGIALLFDSPTRASAWVLDAAGKDRWRLPREQDIGQARDVCLSSADTLVILDADAGALAVFDLHNDKRVDLPIADELGTRPESPEELVLTTTGGFAMREGAVFWFSADGQAWERCTTAVSQPLAWSGSSSISTLVLPDGSLWIADGNLVTHSARDGTPMETLGDLRARESTQELLASTVDGTGRILLQTNARDEPECWSAQGTRLELSVGERPTPAWRVSKDRTQLDPVAGDAALQRRADGHWFRMIKAFGGARDATLAVIDDARFGERDLEGAALTWYGAGDAARGVEHAPWLDEARLACNARWIACWRGNGKLFLFDTRARCWFVHELERETRTGTTWDVHFPPDESELWAISRETRRLVRYALPKDD